MTPTLRRERTRKLPARGGRAELSGDEGDAATARPGPRSPSLLLLLDDLRQAGRGRRRRRHPSRACGRGGRGGRGSTRHAAGISVGLLRAAGIRVLAHGCGQHHGRRGRPRAPGDRARAKGGPGARALTGRGPRAQSPCPSRWRGEETRGAGRRQSARRRLLRLLRLRPRLAAAQQGHAGAGAGGVSRSRRSRSAPGSGQVSRGALRWTPERGARQPPPCALRTPGPALRSAALPREAARRTPAVRGPPRSRLRPELGRLGVVPGDRARCLARPCQAGRTERARGVRAHRQCGVSGAWHLPAPGALPATPSSEGPHTRTHPQCGGTSNLGS